ncbi:hypothetical protein MTO96_015536 [Rhipicephalus appendiculatus]
MCAGSRAHTTTGRSFGPESERAGWAPGAQLGLADRHARSPRPRTPSLARGARTERGPSLPAFTGAVHMKRSNSAETRTIRGPSEEDLSPKEAQGLRQFLRHLHVSEDDF